MPEKVNKILSKLELNEFKLNSLLEITKGINNNFSIDKLLKFSNWAFRARNILSSVSPVESETKKRYILCS